MNIRLRLLDSLLQEIHEDLSRPHSHAFERVGFLSCGIADLESKEILLLGQKWHAVSDQDYIKNDRVGACIGPIAFRKILQYAHQNHACIFHVHRHEHTGVPQFSTTDKRSMSEFIPGFLNACPNRPHGAILISHDSALGEVLIPNEQERLPINRFDIIGFPLKYWRQP